MAVTITITQSQLRQFCREHNIGWAQNYIGLIRCIDKRVGVACRIEDTVIEIEGTTKGSFVAHFDFENDAEMVEFKLKWL